MSIRRFALRDKITLRLLKLYFNITDVGEWSRALHIMVIDWFFSVSLARALSTEKYNSNTAG